MTMRPIPNLPWHAVARRLREQGMSYERICGEVGREIATVRRLLSPGAREEQNARWAKAHRARWARDPEFREKQKKRRRERYATSAEYRAKEAERNRLYKQKTREHRNAKRRERYATDTNFRAQEIARKRARRTAIFDAALACDQARWPKPISIAAKSIRGISSHA